MVRKTVFLWAVMALIGVSGALIVTGGFLFYTLDRTKIIYDHDIIAQKVQEELARKTVFYPDHNPLLYRTGSGTAPAWGRVTSDGFRAPKISNLPDKKSGELRVLIVGDSNEFGLGIESQNDIFTGILNSEAKSRSLNVQFFNISAAGYNVTNSMEAIASFFALIQPDVVIYQYKENDQFLSFYPYLGTYSTIWNYEQFYHDIPFYSETDQSFMLQAYGKGPTNHAKHVSQSYSWHPIFRRDRLKVFQRLKTISDFLDVRKIPFFIFHITTPYTDKNAYMDRTLEEALGELKIKSEVLINTLPYKAPPEAPAHPDKAGHRILAGQIYHVLRSLPGMTNWPMIEEFENYAKGLVRLKSPTELKFDYRQSMPRYAANIEKELSTVISFPPLDPAGVFQIFGRVTPQGYVSYKIAALLPPAGPMLEIEFETPNSPFVSEKPLEISIYNETGELFHGSEPIRAGKNRIRILAPKNTGVFVLELNFKQVFYSKEQTFPYSARIKRIRFRPILGPD